MINLIKWGAFDAFCAHVELIHSYVNEINDVKKRITLQNMKMLIDFSLLPEELAFEQKVFNFNEYLKKNLMKNIIVWIILDLNFMRKTLMLIC